MDAPPTPNGHAPDSGAVEATSGPPPARRRPTPRLSYGQHLKALTQAIAPPLDLPVWATTGRARARKDQARTSLEERRRLLCALDLLNADGAFGSLVAVYAQRAPEVLGTERFLPWHRLYLLQFEHTLQSIHPDVTIPYWNWDPQDAEVPDWMQDLVMTVRLPDPSPPVTVRRAPGLWHDLTMISRNVEQVHGQAAFAPFSTRLEAIHTAIQLWAGGTMAYQPYAPADLLFWMHLANLDRHWHRWQKEHPTKHPDFAGSDAPLAPWGYKEGHTRKIATLGYEYE